MSGRGQSEAAGGTIAPPAQLELFGFHLTPARVLIIPRSTGWRLGHAFGYLGLCWLGMVAAVIPPHFPWLLTAFFLGVYFFVKYIRERYTLVSLAGTCPRCSAPLAVAKPVRLGSPHRVHCVKCGQVAVLRVELPA